MKHNIKVCLQPLAGAALLPVRFRLSWCGLKCDIQAGASWSPDKWISETGRAKNNTKSGNIYASEINRVIENGLAFLENIFLSADAAGNVPTAAEIRQAYKKHFGKQSETAAAAENIQTHLAAFFRELSALKGWARNTQRKYAIIGTIIKRYNIKSAAALNADFLTKFISDCQLLGQKNTTIAKNLRVIKVFISWLFKKGLSAYDCESFRPRLKWSVGNNKALVYMEYNEIREFMAADLSASLTVTRDIFVFCCFSGLRFSDVMALKVGDIRDNKIFVVTQKTADALQIELNNVTAAIYAKYAENNGQAVKLFPKITNQVINRELKTIARKLELYRPVSLVSFSGSQRIEKTLPLCEILSFHAARRTFVVECLRRGIPAEVIMKWTGHNDFKAMRPYMEIVDSLKVSEMQKMNI